VSGDPRVRAYFDARARPFDRLYERRAGLLGRFEAWAYGPLYLRLELTLAELGDLGGKTLLDVGCGSGRYAVAAAERGAEVLGIDISPEMLALARQHASERGVADRCRFVLADFDAFAPEERFDVVLMVSVVEYRSSLGADVMRLHDLAREKAIVTVPLPHRWQMLARRARHRWRAAPPTLHSHSPAAVAACLHEAGFESSRSDRGWFVAYSRGVAAGAAEAVELQTVAGGPS
jgi:SAM-dependent methyltransferase